MTTTAYKPVVTVDARGSILIVLRATDPVPAFIHGLVTREGITPENVRYAVGAKYFDAQTAAAFNQSIVDSLVVYNQGKIVRTSRGSHWSGGTANPDADQNLKDDMPTVLPGLIAAAYPTVAFSTTPKTAAFIAQNYVNGGLLPSAYETRIDFRQHLNIIFEPNIDMPFGDWDGDVPLYVGLQDDWDKINITTGILGANGGPVALLEFIKAIEKRRRAIFMRGSKRECDAVCAGLDHGNFTLLGKEQRDIFIGKRDKDGATTAVKDKMQQNIEAWDATIEGYKSIIAGADRNFIRVIDILDVKALNTAWQDLGFLKEYDEVDEDPNAKAA